MLSRRTLLASGAAMLALPLPARAAPIILTAGPAQGQILPDGEPATAMLGFNNSTPGPELRVKQGETLSVRFENRMDEGTAVHWHGIRLNNAMDGVPGVTQPLVGPGETFDYEFTVPDAGTYWYHSHHQSWEQVAKGLYGPLIVDEVDPPEVDEDITVLLDDWRIDVDTGEMMGDFGNMHDFAHGGRLGNYAKIMPSKTEVRVGDRVRLRLINAATARIFPVRIEGLAAKVVALDGMPLPSPRALEDFFLAPAQRIDVIGDVVAPVTFVFLARDQQVEMGTIEAVGQNDAPMNEPIPALAQATVAMPKAEPDQRLSMRMEGGAMAGRHAGDDIWALNGWSGMSDVPFASFRRGETAVIELINDTRFPHGMHLHGHHFHELDADGGLGDYRDTTLVDPGSTRQIAVVFDNPGKWLLHCHMLGHQASGMKTWVEVN